LSKKPNAHRRFDLEKVMAWLEERSEVKEDGGEQPG